MERTFAWLYNFERLLVRYERRGDPLHTARARLLRLLPPTQKLNLKCLLKYNSSPGSSLCSGFAAAPTGAPTAPGVLKVGVLMPIGGVWRLFLQVKVGGRVVTAPYTLHVGA